jgi:hypothetical protein
MKSISVSTVRDCFSRQAVDADSVTDLLDRVWNIVYPYFSSENEFIQKFQLIAQRTFRRSKSACV